jgi:hypothetical protein
LVGDAVGYAVGYAVGAAVGAAVGYAVGYAVGMATHSVSPSASAVHLAAAHAWHSWYFSLSWYLPVGQWSQLVLPVHAWNLPTLQFLHSPPVVAWYWPIAQSAQNVDADRENWPFGHETHTAAEDV